MKWSDVYQWAGILGQPVGSMTLFEFRCAVKGYRRANGVTDGALISDKRLAELGIEGF